MPTRRALLGAGAGIAVASSSTLLVGSPLAQARPRPRRGRGPNWGQLCAALQGDLVLPGDSRYDRARQLASAQFDHLRPQAVAYCETATDVPISSTASPERRLSSVTSRRSLEFSSARSAIRISRSALNGFSMKS